MTSNESNIPRRELAVPAAIAGLSQSIERLEKVAVELEDRLGDILERTTANPNATCEKAATPLGLAGSITERRLRIDAVTEIVMRIVVRLEL